MLRKPAVMIVTILSFILFSALFFTACEDTLLTEPAISESAPESLIPESPVPGDLGAFSLAKGKPGCTTIQDGVLTYSDQHANHWLEDQPLQVGYDAFGYNYQAHLFNGSYANAYLGKDGFPPYEGDTDAYLAENPDFVVYLAEDKARYWQYRDVELTMKWNDAWLSNKDCNDDGILDRPSNPIGSGAWDTNHQSGVYDDGTKWTYFVKIVAAPAYAYKEPANANGSTIPGTWYTADGTEIGPVIWGSFARIQQVSNDPSYGEHGILYKSPASPGLGNW